MSRVLFDFGFLQIYWYSVCIMFGMIIGMYLVYKEAKKHKISEDTITNLIFYTIVISIIGARFYYVIFNLDYYSKNIFESLEIWNGGLAIHGAIIFGGLYLISFTRKKKINTLKVLDICAVGLIIGQAIGRWGNFFNQEAYGSVTSLEFLKSLFLPQFIIDGMNINGVYYQPTFLYESIWCIIGFVIMIFYRKRKYIKIGQIFGIYCMWYGFGRFVIESMRQDSLMLGSLKMAQIVSIGMFLVGLYFFVRKIRSGKFDYLYHEENGVLTTPVNSQTFL
ncbi:MAG: prolipoprotein diacylglyceryl transferase [Bacilli bacterium]|nr:prolipoprotein diacylglyceryl transferase [Bacilli bacterium]